MVSKFTKSSICSPSWCDGQRRAAWLVTLPASGGFLEARAGANSLGARWLILLPASGGPSEAQQGDKT